MTRADTAPARITSRSRNGQMFKEVKYLMPAVAARILMLGVV